MLLVLNTHVIDVQSVRCICTGHMHDAMKDRDLNLIYKKLKRLVYFVL